MDSTYLRFEEVPTSDQESRRWKVGTKRGTYLGHIRWFAPWRQYVFYPSIDTLYSVGCLRDIAKFIETRG